MKFDFWWRWVMPEIFFYWLKKCDSDFCCPSFCFVKVGRLTVLCFAIWTSDVVSLIRFFSGQQNFLLSCLVFSPHLEKVCCCLDAGCGCGCGNGWLHNFQRRQVQHIFLWLIPPSHPPPSPFRASLSTVLEVERVWARAQSPDLIDRLYLSAGKLGPWWYCSGQRLCLLYCQLSSNPTGC